MIRRSRTKPQRRFPDGGRRGAWRMLLALALAACAGCLFSARTPDPPYNPEEVPWNAATDPEFLLQNIKKTFEAKQTPNYDRATTSDFVFRPDPGDSTLTGGFCFLNWTKTKEMQIFNNLFKTKGKLAFSWTDFGDLRSTDKPDEEYYHQIRYRMAFSAPGPDTAFAGKADLYVRNVNGEWTLFKWIDTRSSADTLTLGRVRCAGGVISP